MNLAEKIQNLQAGKSNLAPGDYNFAWSLIRQFNERGRLSPRQEEWVDKLLERATPATSTTNLSGLFTIFATATSNGLKRPAVIIRSGETDFRLSMAKAESRNAGSIYVKVSGDYAGKVRPNGVFEPAGAFRGADGDALTETLLELSTDPVAAAQRFARATGRCSFCGLALEDERSTAVGYGPVCAKKWGLHYPTKAELSATTAVGRFSEAPAA